MTVVTYTGNIDPRDRTSELHFRGGGLVVPLGSYADLTQPEIDSVSDRVVLALGIVGPAAQATLHKGSLRFVDLSDTPAAEDFSDGSSLVWSAGQAKLLPGPAGSGVAAWAASTTYAKDQAVRFGGQVYTARATFTSGATFDPTKWNLAAAAPTNTALRGLTPMVSRLRPLVSSLSSGATGTADQDWIIGYPVLVDGIIERVLFSYIPVPSSPETTAGLTPLTMLACALQYGGVLYKLRFNGREQFTIDPDGGSIYSDPVNLPVVPGQLLYLKAHNTVAAAGTGDLTSGSNVIANVRQSSLAPLVKGQQITGTGIPANSYIGALTSTTITLTTSDLTTASNATATNTGVALSAFGKYARGTAANGANDAASNTTTNNAYTIGTPAPGAGGQVVFSPIAILGRPTAGPRPIVIFAGDSVDYGQGNTNAEESFLTQAFQAANVPYINLSVGGDQATKWVASLGGRWRSAIAAGGTSAVIGLQTNDLAVAARTPAQFESDLLQIATWFKTLGVRKVFTRTDTPRPGASTQAKADRITINNWKRDGHPIDATTKVAVATGTSSNVLRGGDPGHPIDALPLETADVWEGTRNSGIWVPAYDSGDATHPSPAGHTAAQAPIAARISEFV